MTGFLAVVALLGVALFPQRIVGWFGGGGQETAPLAAESERPRTAPGAEPELRPTLTEPFRGSPAARWADGAAGITVPAARATGWMDKAQVARALAQSKEFLVAAGLDSHVLRGERPSKAIAVLNPRQKDVQRYLRAALSAKTPTPKRTRSCCSAASGRTRPGWSVTSSRRAAALVPGGGGARSR